MLVLGPRSAQRFQTLGQQNSGGLGKSISYQCSSIWPLRPRSLRASVPLWLKSFGACCLKFLWSLDVGVWSFRLASLRFGHSGSESAVKNLRSLLFRFWSLVSGASLDVGCWCLDHVPRSGFKHWGIKLEGASGSNPISVNQRGPSGSPN